MGDDLYHKPRQDSPFPDGYRFDYLNQDALLNRIRVVGGTLQIPEGTTWKVLWLPDDQCRRLTPETLERLRQLLQDGDTVIGAAPWVANRVSSRTVNLGLMYGAVGIAGRYGLRIR